MPSNTHNTLPRPGLLRRLMAIVYDSFLLAACCMAISATVIMGKIMIVGAATIEASGKPAVSGDVEKALLFSLSVLTFYGFYCWFWRKKGQTLAMQAWRLKIVNRDGGTITRAQCLKRFAGAFVSLLCVGLGFLWILIDKDRLTWHDRWSGTELQLLPKSSREG